MRTLSIFDFRSCSSSLAHTDIISFHSKHYLNLNLSSCASRKLKIDTAVLRFIIKSLLKMIEHVCQRCADLNPDIIPLVTFTHVYIYKEAVTVVLIDHAY